MLPPPAVPFDPLRTWLPVRLRPECDDSASWLPAAEPEPAPRPSPVHDYLARDWAGLRQALVEFLHREYPDADLSPADPDITVAELFAHVGDLLHYRLDRQATEAYLETARRRTSVRRHVRLVDYRLGEAVSARTQVLVQPPPGAAPFAVPAGTVAADAPGSPLAFTVEADLTVQPARGEIPVYDWTGDAFELPEGATECVLVRPAPADPLGDAWLGPGDLLAFEVVDASDTARQHAWAGRAVTWPLPGPAFREPLPSRPAHVVALTAVAPLSDPLAPALPLYTVRWSPAEALPRAYPVTVDDRAGAPEVTVARANLVPAHHGRLAAGPGVLRAGPPGEYHLDAAATGPVARRADGSPYRLDVDVVLPSGSTVHPDLVPSLVEVADPVLACVLETEDGVPPVLRFRTGATGLLPPGGSTVAAAYEVGAGTDGNLPANVLRVLERNVAGPGLPPQWQQVAAARNPVPAAGGAEPEPSTGPAGTRPRRTRRTRAARSPRPTTPAT
ncbi:baseplate J/gp47 family protein [Dactylosporangium cerinum]